MLVAKMAHQIPKGTLPGASTRRGVLLWTADGELVDGSLLTSVGEDVHRWRVVANRASLVAVHDGRDAVVAEVVSAAPCEVWIFLNLAQADGAVIVIGW